jgi:two-component system sensor kinase FixL
MSSGSDGSDGSSGGDTSVVVEIADTGPGVSAEASARLFEPFFTTRDTGTGLGLPITRRIVETHGGSITVTNDAKGGASARIVLPVAIKDATP